MIEVMLLLDECLQYAVATPMRFHEFAAMSLRMISLSAHSRARTIWQDRDCVRFGGA
jgi:hypothetical protein